MRVLFKWLSALSLVGFSVAALAIPPLDQAAPPKTKAASKASRTGSQIAATSVAAQPSEAFVCPNAADKTAIACFLNATAHLYAVCSNVKAIELAEFGYEEGEVGRNGFKSDFCRQKQLASIPRYYAAALREAENKHSCEVVVELHELYAAWETFLMAIKPYPEESEEHYRQRVKVPADTFAAYQEQINDAIVNKTPTKEAVNSCIIQSAGAKKATKSKRGRSKKSEDLPPK